MTSNSRLPRKLKKVIKLEDVDKWMKFLEEKKASKIRAEHIDKLFRKDYDNAYKIFHKSIKHGR